MDYHFLNIKYGISINRKAESWHTVLETAKQEGWQPEGTRFDYQFELDDYVNDEIDMLGNLFNTLLVHYRFLQWDGNYYEKENQLVTSTDAHSLSISLRGISDDREFLDFLEKGAFRICENSWTLKNLS